MKNIAEKQKTVSIEGFGGIDTLRAHTSPKSPSDIVNFRIRADGSLEKREGYFRLCDLGIKIRAVFTGIIEGQYRCYALARNGVYSIDPYDGRSLFIGHVDTYDTDADFFYYRNNLYLIDGHRFYRVTDQGIYQPHGYVPLVGKDWSDSVRGEPYEPRNLLNNKGRISYILSQNPSSVLYLDEEVSIIDAVYINGTLIDPERYSTSSIAPILNITGLCAGDRVCIYFTYANTPYTPDELMKNTRAIVFGGISNSRPFLFGGTDASVMYSSAYVSEDSLAASQLVYPQSDALYFPQGYEFTVGDGRYPISAVSRHYDRLLIFTEGGAWQADSSACGTEDFPVMSINSLVGVKSPHGATLLGNFPCTVGKDGIYKWTTDTDKLDDCNAYRISEPIEALIPNEFYSSACVFADSRRRELLISSPSTTDRVWVYSEAISGWTSFDGIGAERFFELHGNVGFVKDGGLYAFDSSCYNDCGAEISASFTSGICDFDTDSAKHLCSIGMSLDGGDIEASIYTDKGELPVASTVLVADNKQHTNTRKRLSSSRFSYLTARLGAHGSSRPTIHSLYIKAR